MSERLSILLVEDNLLNQRIVTFSLKKFKHEVVIANNGLEGLNMYKSQKFDVVLMDIMMPVMDGYETMRNIRNKFEFKDLPIIAITAKAMKEDRQKCIEAGANDYLSKPVNTEKLFNLMRVWLYQ